jgi:hypothetical protein
VNRFSSYEWIDQCSDNVGPIDLGELPVDLSMKRLGMFGHLAKLERTSPEH